MQDNGAQALVEKLRTKSKSSTLLQLPWADFGRQMRMATLEHRTQRNMPVVQLSLERLQGVMRATDLSDVLERIEPLCRPLKLQYVRKHTGVFISSDAFYLEIQLDPDSPTDFIKDVKVAHGTSAVACPHVVDTLKKGDFTGFQEHLKGFLEMYSITGDKSLKRKFFIVLQSLESDINNLAQVQSGFSTGANYQALLYRYPLGMYTPRRDGLPLRLTYFVTPYDLVNEQTKDILPFNTDVIRERGLGLSATIGIEQSPNFHQLQTIPLMSISRNNEGKQFPAFAALTSANSVSLSAVFILKLNKPMPVTKEVLSRIESITAIPIAEKAELRPLMDIITNVETVSGNTASLSKSKDHILYVSLPGQEHRYFVNEPTDDGLKYGAFVHKIPFSHPTHVPKVLMLLRQQAALNAVLLSCVRPSSKQRTSCHHMELTVVSLSSVNVLFESAAEQSLSTVDFDVSDLIHFKCKLINGATQIAADDEATATRIFQRTFSIPITMRALLEARFGQMETNDIDGEASSAVPPAKRAIAAAMQPTASTGSATAITQQLTEYYTARGHYMPFGSLNTISTAYAKNIQSNQYSLCLRRFSGYRRRPLPRSAMPFKQLVAHCNTADNILLGVSGGGGGSGSGPAPGGNSGPPPGSGGSGLQQQQRGRGAPGLGSDEENRASKNPMLASLLDDDLGKGVRSSSSSGSMPTAGSGGHYVHQHAPILTDLLEGSELAAGDTGANSGMHYQPVGQSATAASAAAGTKKAAAPRKRRPTTEGGSSSGGGGGSSKRRKKSESGGGGGNSGGSVDGIVRPQQLSGVGARSPAAASSIKAGPTVAVRPQLGASGKILSSSLPSQRTVMPSPPSAQVPPLARSAASTVSSNPGLANLLSQSVDADKGKSSLADGTDCNSGYGCGSASEAGGPGCNVSASYGSGTSGRDRPPLRRSSSFASDPDATPGSASSSRDAVFEEKPLLSHPRDDRLPALSRDQLPATDTAASCVGARGDGSDTGDGTAALSEHRAEHRQALAPPTLSAAIVSAASSEPRKDSTGLTVKISKSKERRLTDKKLSAAERSQSACETAPKPEKKRKGSSSKLMISASLGDLEVSPHQHRGKVRESHSLEIVKAAVPGSPTRKVDPIKITKAKTKSTMPSASQGDIELKHKAPKRSNSSDSKQHRIAPVTLTPPSAGVVGNLLAAAAAGGAVGLSGDRQPTGDDAGAKDFYRATNLSALPKIPKRKPDVQQQQTHLGEAKTPTSPTPASGPNIGVGGGSAPSSIVARALLQPPTGSVAIAAAAAQPSAAGVPPPRTAPNASAMTTPSRPALLPTPPSPTLSPGGSLALNRSSGGGSSSSTWLQPPLAGGGSSGGSLSPGASSSAAATASSPGGMIPPPPKQRKSSLNAVIDKLTSKSGSGGNGKADEPADLPAPLLPSPGSRTAPALAIGGVATAMPTYTSSSIGGMPRLPPLHVGSNLRVQTAPNPALAARLPLPPLLLPPSRPSPTALSSPAAGLLPTFPPQYLRQNSGGSLAGTRLEASASLTAAVQQPRSLQAAPPIVGRAGVGTLLQRSGAAVSPPNGKVSRAPPQSPDASAAPPPSAISRAPVAIPAEPVDVEGADPASPLPQPAADAGYTKAIPLEVVPAPQQAIALQGNRAKGVPAATSAQSRASGHIGGTVSARTVVSSAAGGSGSIGGGEGLAHLAGSPQQYSDSSPASSVDLIIHDPDEDRDAATIQLHGGAKRGAEAVRNSGSKQSSMSSSSTNGNCAADRAVGLQLVSAAAGSASCSPSPGGAGAASPTVSSIDDELMDEAIACDTSITF